ncbi:MAG: trypsin-like peptidase domain-containing protein [Planctomycetota bacterium]
MSFLNEPHGAHESYGAAAAAPRYGAPTTASPQYGAPAVTAPARRPFRERSARYGAPDRRGIIVPPYDPSRPALEQMEEWLADLERFLVGVPNEVLTQFPHSSICELQVTTALGGFSGTGFYVTRDKILTAAHVVEGIFNGQPYHATSIRVHPGRSPNMSTFPAFDLNDTRSFAVHPQWVAGGRRSNFDLAVLHAPTPPPERPMNMTNMTAHNTRVLVCGYAAARGAELEELRQSVPIEPHQQHLGAGHIRGFDDGGETMLYAAQSQGGTSGAPVYRVDHGELRVYGIHHGIRGIPRNRTVACRLTPAKIDFVNNLSFPRPAGAWPPAP